MTVVELAVRVSVSVGGEKLFTNTTPDTLHTGIASSRSTFTT